MRGKSISIAILFIQIILYNNNMNAQNEHPFWGDLNDAYKHSNLMLDNKAINILFAKLPKPKDFVGQIGLSLELPEPKNEEEALIIVNTIDSLCRKFFYNVKNGIYYSPVSKIKERFGENPSDRIGISSGGYYRLFVAYWTFQIKLSKYQSENISRYGYGNNYMLDQLLAIFENSLSGNFFPTPGPFKVSDQERHERIQAMLDRCAPSMTINELYEGADLKKTRWPIIK